jgi:hypothetical protein
MKYELSAKNVQAIEKAINKSPGAEAIVKIENSKVVVFQTEKKKIV